MHVAVCRMKLHLSDNRSLKGKRRIVRSLCDRLRHRFRVGVAEVAGQELWQHAVIGIVTVSSDAGVARSVLEKAADYAEGLVAEAVITGVEFDVFQYEDE